MGSDNAAKPVNFRDVAERVMSTIPLFVMQDDSTFYVYKNGVYISDGAEPILNRAIRSIADDMNIDRGFTPNPVNRKFVAEVFDYIRVHKVIPRNRIGAKLHILNLKNGLLNLENMEFTEHDSKYYSIIQYPVKYDPAAECKTIGKFLEETVQPGDLETLVEYTGYSLVPGNSFKVLAMLYGGRDAGKSTYCNLVEAMFGKQYTAHVPPQTIQENKFAASQLYGKVLNIVPDIGDKPLSGTESIKTLLGNDEITADQKYKSGIHFVNKSHIFWGANKIPDIKNDDIDFYDKVLMVNFPHRFDETNADRTLISRMTSETELSGFLNLLIAARKRLLNRGKFRKTETGMNSRDRYRINSNPLDMFIEAHIVASVDDLPKAVMFDRYQSWCASKGIRPYPVNKFGKQLKAKGFTDSQYRIDGSVKRVWDEVAFVEHKPNIQQCLPDQVPEGGIPPSHLGCTSVPACTNEIGGTGSKDTAEGDVEKNTTVPVYQYFPLKIVRENKNIYVYREKLPQKSTFTGTAPADSVSGCTATGAVLVDSVCTGTAPTDDDSHPLPRDILVYVRKAYPDLIVNDVVSFVNSFCKKYPNHKAKYGTEYIQKLAMILRSRGWRQ